MRRISSHAPERRQRFLRIRVSDAERLQWQAQASEAGVSVSELIRRSLPGSVARAVPPRTKADPELVRQLARIGNNLNQIARVANTHQDNLDVVQVCTALAAIRAELRQLQGRS